MNLRDGEIVLETAQMIVVRGHYNPEEMQRRTGFQGGVRQSYWRHADPRYPERKAIVAPNGRFVRSRKGRGAFAVTILNIIRDSHRLF